MGVSVVENLSRVFLSEWLLYNLWVIKVYIVWTLKNPPGRTFHENFKGLTRKILTKLTT